MNVIASDRRVGLIGCGRWGRNIARALARMGALEVIADPAAEHLRAYSEELGVRLVPGPTEVLADPAIAAVVIAAPAIDHAKLVSAALAAGKHVFVEKPLALHLADAERLSREAAAAGLTLMVGHLLQYHPAFVRLRELVLEGRIGDLRHVTSHRLNPGAIRTEENALWSMAPHDFSMILSLTGCEPSDVEALAVTVVDEAIPDEFSVQLRFPNGCTGLVRASWISPFKEHKLVVLGTTGAIVFEDTAADPARKLVLYKGYVDLGGGAPRFVKGPGEAMTFPGDEPLMAEIAWFLECVAGRQTPRTGPEEAIPVLRALHAASRAAGL